MFKQIFSVGYVMPKSTVPVCIPSTEKYCRFVKQLLPSRKVLYVFSPAETLEGDFTSHRQ